MNSPAADLDTLQKLESWQEELLIRLEQLDKRVEEVLREYQASYRPKGPGQR